jgi:hypothetical protein
VQRQRAGFGKAIQLPQEHNTVWILPQRALRQGDCFVVAPLLGEAESWTRFPASPPTIRAGGGLRLRCGHEAPIVG